MKEFWLYFVLFALCSTALFLLQNDLLISESFYYDTYAGKLSINQIDNIIEVQQKWGWAGCFFIPILSLVKIALVSCCLMAGLLVVNKNAPYDGLFLLSVKAEFISLVFPISTLIWFLIIHRDYTSEELSSFSPFSLLIFFEPIRLEPWKKYVLGSLNLLEVLYMLTLAYGLKVLLTGNFGSALKVVAMSYGMGFSLWVLFIGFVIINVSV